VARRGEPAAVGVRRGADARRDRGQHPRHRPAHARHPAGARAPARPRQRPGRHHHRRLVPRHLGDQRPARRVRRHALDDPARHGRLGGVVRAPGRGADRGAPGGQHRRRRPARRRPARHPPRRVGRARAARPDRVLLLQQLHRRRVHGGDGPLRPRTGVRAGVGAAVGCAEHGRDRRRAAHHAHRRRRQPGAHAPAGQPRAVDGLHRVPAAVVDRAAGGRGAAVDAGDAVRGGGRADDPAAGGALRAAGPGLRVRAERGAGGVAPHRVPRRPAHAVRHDPVHDRRRGRAVDRPVVRHRPGPRHGAGVHRHGRHRAVVTLLALASRPYRQLSEAYHDKIAASGTPEGSRPS